MGMMIYKPKKKVKHYDFSRKPKRPTPILLVATIGSSIALSKRKLNVSLDNSLKTPHLILGNHGGFNDFYMFFKVLKSWRLNFVAGINAHNDGFMFDWLLRQIGSIPKRRFVSEISLMKNMKHSLYNLKNHVLMYPEAKYSLDGSTSFIPPSLGKLVKFLKVPVSTFMLNGNYVSNPHWNPYKEKTMPMDATLKEIITLEEIDKLSVDEINQRIKSSLIYDDWKWLKESGNKITYKNRANNLNALLYQCPNCKTEFKMHGEGTTLTCTACDKKWEMQEDGELVAHDGNTEFSHIPDWFKWQKQNVHDEIVSGKYKMEANCKVFTLPYNKGFVVQKDGKLYQDFEKTILTVNLYGEDKVIEYNGFNLENIHLEYKFKGLYDMADFSIPGDNIWMSPIDKKDIITKISIATEEIRDIARLKLKESK